MFPDFRIIIGIVEYEWRRWDHRRRNTRARRLLKSLLSVAQWTEAKRRVSFTVMGSAGGRYRLWPNTGSVERVESHGKYMIAATRFCLHEEGERELPAADLSIAHMLMLRTDEPGFLALANHNEVRHAGWDGEWHRRLRVARIANAAMAQGEAEAAA